MLEEGPNPSKILTGPRTVNPRRPLVLIHDGGGTTFAYFLFGNLNRDVWALHSPKYFSGEGWEGGMKEVAKTYIGLMKDAGIKGNILFGCSCHFSRRDRNRIDMVIGWSFGGLAAVEIARAVADDPDSPFKVDGMVIIDSPFQLPPDQRPANVDPDLSDLPELVRKAFDNADSAVTGWQAPAWDGSTLGGKDVKVRVGATILDVGLGQVAHKPVKGQWTVVDSPKHEQEAAADGKTPPPAVFIKATKNVAPAKGSDQVCDIDYLREEKLLGWGGRYPDFIKAVIDFDNNHFDMFDKMNFEQVRCFGATGTRLLTWNNSRRS